MPAPAWAGRLVIFRCREPCPRSSACAGPARQPGRCRRRRAAVAHGRGGRGVRIGQDVTGHRNTDSRWLWWLL